MNFENKDIPVLALRGLNIFPEMIITLDVQREISINAVNMAMNQDQLIFITAQKDAGIENPKFNDVYEIGVVAAIRQILRLPNNNMRVLVEGIEIARLMAFTSKKVVLKGKIEPVKTKKVIRKTKKTEAMVRNVISLFEEYFSLSNHIQPDAVLLVNNSSDDVDKFTYLVCANINAPVEDRQSLLEITSSVKRLEAIIKLLISENEILRIEDDIQSKVKQKIDKNQKEYFLREQIKIIQNELGDREDITLEVNEYIKKLSKYNLSEEIEDKILKEIKRLQLMPTGSHEATVVRTYLDTVFDLPWDKKTKENTDLAKCERMLNKEHYGLLKVKERILEYLAVRQQAPEKNGMILCLIGPPGVGKTSIVSSVAKAIGRKFARLSLGGIRDEADIRGHRKTYIGAMPGRIINAVKIAGSKNPLILLDEIDKMASDFRGDPASALLEVLDKEQNHNFRDHFLEVPFDLSDVMFITTANSASTIPPALYDRLEVIELSSYTYLEKFNIAKKHLLPKQLKEHNVNKSTVSISDDAIKELIDYYTIEAGVRNLERELATLIRKAVYDIKKNNFSNIKINANDVSKYLGGRKYIEQNDTDINEPGIANGLAYTSYGGTLLNIEVNILEGKGNIELTGKLGDVMKESAKAAICYIRSKANSLNIDKDFYNTKDIHIHVPEGATPKDGPSAGITMATALVSALTGRAVRSDIAMTGEITIRGRVLAIGGLKEKSLAAHRNKINNIIIPYDNIKDIEEIPEEIAAEFNFIPVKNMDEVLNNALV